MKKRIVATLALLSALTLLPVTPVHADVIRDQKMGVSDTHYHNKIKYVTYKTKVPGKYQYGVYIYDTDYSGIGGLSIAKVVSASTSRMGSENAYDEGFSMNSYTIARWSYFTAY